MSEINILPLVSICTPCYNHEKYLCDYFESIINQTYERIELIIIDDVSSDGSVQLIQSYLPRLQERFERVYFEVNKTNQGVTKNCNIALSYAQGEYISALASDDMLSPTAIEDMVQYLQSNEQVGVLVTNGYKVPDAFSYNNPVKQYRKVYTTNIGNIFKNITNFQNALLTNNFIFAPGTMIRNSVFITHGYFDENMIFEDYEYWLRLSSKVPFGYMNKALVYYRIADTSLSNYQHTKSKEKFVKIVRGEMQAKMKYIRVMPNEQRKKWMSNMLNQAIKMSLAENYINVAVRLWWIAKRKKVQIDYSIIQIVFNLKEKGV